MALLHIEDPAGAAVPIGIDLGTTNSVVARVTATGAAQPIFDCNNQALVPSVVHYRPDGGVEVGETAVDRLESSPEDTITSAKRFMGLGADDPETRALGTYRFASNDGPVVRFEVAGGRSVTPVEVSAEILRELRTRAIDNLGAIGGAVITVPAYFDDSQRQATKDAAELAGLEVLRLLNEPTAAALAYGVESQKNGVFVVYDLGGGTFDVTVLSLDDGVFQVLATGGDSHLGGDDFDRVIAEWMIAELGFASREDLSAHGTRSVLSAGRDLKHMLSTSARAAVSVRDASGQEREVWLDRDRFERLIGPFVTRTLDTCREVLRDAGVGADRVDGVILVGGATRVPLVRDRIEDLFGKRPLADIDPDQVVALGAALQADVLGGRGPRDDVLLLDVMPLSFGIETVGGVVERILPRNTPIPAEAAQVFTTYADNQTGFELHVVQGEREFSKDCRSLAKFTLRGIPPMPAGLARLEVRFSVDANGLLQVSAKELRTGVEQQIDVKSTYGLTDEEVESMLLDAYEHGEDDIRLRSLREQRTEARRILAAIATALDQDGELLEDGEREAIEGAIGQLEAAASEEDSDAIREQIERLDAISKPFAGRRMDRSIRHALRGKDVSAVERDTRDAKGIEEHLRRADAKG